jgi:hypothetical protein
VGKAALWHPGRSGQGALQEATRPHVDCGVATSPQVAASLFYPKHRGAVTCRIPECRLLAGPSLALPLKHLGGWAGRRDGQGQEVWTDGLIPDVNPTRLTPDVTRILPHVPEHGSPAPIGQCWRLRSASGSLAWGCHWGRPHGSWAAGVWMERPRRCPGEREPSWGSRRRIRPQPAWA